jgi:large subunit ribosomal protein L9
MEVILRDDVQNLGKIGDVVRVRDGYARNFLLPRGLAIEANRRNLGILEHQRRLIGAKVDRERKEGEALARRLAVVAITVTARAGEDGRLFGSVTNLDVERLLRERGFTVDRRRILLEEPIKALGNYTVTIQVARDLQTAISVTVAPAADE